MTVQPSDLTPRLLDVWANRQDAARRRAFADWFADAVPPAEAAPAPPLPGGNHFRRHWRACFYPFVGRSVPTEPAVLRDLKKLRGGVSCKRTGVSSRPFAYLGRITVGGIDCLVGDSTLAPDRALRAAENLQCVLSLPVTVAFDQRPGTDLCTRVIVWRWPAGSGPSLWRGERPGPRCRRPRPRSGRLTTRHPSPGLGRAFCFVRHTTHTASLHHGIIVQADVHGQGVWQAEANQEMVRQVSDR